MNDRIGGATMSETCIFCKIIRGEIPADIVEETAHTLTILDRFPAARGHALVLLKKHREFLSDCTAVETAHVADAVRRAAAGIRKAMVTDAMNVVNNNGKIAGQVIPHVHFHIVPRYPGDGLKMEFKQSEVSDAERAEVATAIRNAL
jgi:histidine triad (HIT) family protein